MNVSIQIVTTILFITVHLVAIHLKEQSESLVELISIYTIGLTGWFSIVSGLLGFLIANSVVFLYALYKWEQGQAGI